MKVKISKGCRRCFSKSWLFGQCPSVAAAFQQLPGCLRYWRFPICLQSSAFCLDVCLLLSYLLTLRQLCETEQFTDKQMKECEGEEETTQRETLGGRGLTERGRGWRLTCHPTEQPLLALTNKHHMGQRWCCTYCYARPKRCARSCVSSCSNVFSTADANTSACGNTTSFSSLTNPSPHTAEICMEISSGRLSEPGLQSSRWELVSSESLSNCLPTAAAFLLPRINVPPFHGQCGTVEVRLLDWYQAWT